MYALAVGGCATGTTKSGETNFGVVLPGEPISPGALGEGAEQVMSWLGIPGGKLIGGLVGVGAAAWLRNRSTRKDADRAYDAEREAAIERARLQGRDEGWDEYHRASTTQLPTVGGVPAGAGGNPRPVTTEPLT